MGAYFEYFVRLDSLSSDEIDTLSGELSEWLLGEGVIAPNTSVDELWHPYPWIAGPSWRDVVVPIHRNNEELYGNSIGVDIDRKRSLRTAWQFDEAPFCPSCRQQLDQQRYYSCAEPWEDHGEPIVTCERCGHSALVGDWTSPDGHSYVVGAPAIIFYDWPRLTDAFVTAAVKHVGGRARHVSGKF